MLSLGNDYAHKIEIKVLEVMKINNKTDYMIEIYLIEYLW